MRKSVLMAAAALAGVFVLAPALTANAETNGTQLGPKHRLQTQLSTYYFADGSQGPSINGSTASWSSGSDSPIDNGNNKAYRVNVAAGDPGVNSDFAVAFSTFSTESANKPVGSVKNLSFDFLTAQNGGGTPRISVQFDNGDVAYLASSGCANPFAVSPSWSRADFTGRTATGCSFPVAGATGGTYASDGTDSAWKNYVDANPTQQVASTYMVFDEAGNWTVDRISLGYGKMWNNASNKGLPCNTEAAC